MGLTQEPIRALVEEAKYDEVGLWLVVSELKRSLGLTDAASIKQATLECVAQLIATGEIDVGYCGPGPRGVALWNLGTTDAVISRISRAWDMLGREPNIGEVAVLIGKSTPG